MNISNYYTIDTETWIKTYDIDKLPNQETCQVIASECISNARAERLKSFGNGLMAAGATFVLLYVARIIGTIASLIVGIVTLPLAVIPPLYALVTLIGGIVAGAAFAYFTIRATGKIMLNQAKMHWNHANHYNDQAIAANFRKAAFAKGETD